ncbi:adhesion G-protein coupled receptor F2 [Scophthalmus maximus]|uniref:adhesion G-protein coupled receptor F2 n=1 Tax=Scophthalmus maximus TaxID=52904 RepID=UPI0015E10742|nr:adhesion G-protein coupled receptor F2 [Scophthalmus maximus]XP_035474039.1 adhesion G-protein coupled receptor F2 [Scophthalmus maximus]
MFSKVCLFLLGAVAGYFYQIVAVEEIYVAELMVESNITLEASTILSVLNTELQVEDSSGVLHTVTILQGELVAECIIIGPDSNCDCSVGFVWSNEVCYSSDCCSETTCKKNVSQITPLCIAKVKVQISGSVTLKRTIWDDAKTNQLKAAFGRLNGYVRDSLNMTGYRESKHIADFEAAFGVKLRTSALQDVINELESSLTAEVLVNTVGMVTIESPRAPVCYQSIVVLKCTFEEATGSADWKLIKKNSHSDLNNGSFVKLDSNCATQKYDSCVEVTLKNVTSIWAGTYECGFTNGSVTHTATTQLSVALLPDEIIMESNPITVDCSGDSQSSDIYVRVTATIPNTTESLNVSWMNTDIEPIVPTIKPSEDSLVYSVKAKVTCDKKRKAKNVSISFTNTMGQKKHAQLDIPVIIDGAEFCGEEEKEYVLWPKTPAGVTVINRTCAEGRVGNKSRTCNGTTWQPVFSYCVTEELMKVFNLATDFEMGLGATQKMAMDIFKGLNNNSTLDSDPSETLADIFISIRILNVMASASKSFVLQEEVFQDFLEGASNMLKSPWDLVNSSVVQDMSSNYLGSVEGLVKNIRVNSTTTISSTNLDLKVCPSGSDCNVFNISVTLNTFDGKMKTVAVKNLTDKLNNNFHTTEHLNNLLVIATLESQNSSLEISLEFFNEQPETIKPYCVFWNTTDSGWSDAGCIAKPVGNHIVCKCNHLTSFSVLMSKSDLGSSNIVIDVITYVGLGLSICSLLIFLIVESLVWSVVVKTNLSHFRHTALVNIATFLLLADCSFLASTAPGKLTGNWCLILTMCKHLFYLAMFSWMMCMSVMLVHQLIFVFSPLRKRVFIFLSSIVGYVCPCLIVGFSYLYCTYTKKPYHTDKCWLVFEKLLEGSLHAFLIPVGTVIFTNVFSMVVVIVTLLKSTAPDGRKADEKETAKSIIKVVVFLTPVFGVTWGIGFILLMLNEDDTMYTVANYSFVILNSFQGFFVMLTGCLTEQKVRGELLRIIMAKPKNDSMKNLTSATHAKDK